MVLKTAIPLCQNENRLAFLQIPTNLKSWNLDFHRKMLRKAGFELLPFWTMFKFLRVAIGAGTLFFPKMGDAQLPDSHFLVNIIFPTVSCSKKCSIFSPVAYKNLNIMLLSPTYFRHWVCVSPWSNCQGICPQIFIGDVARNGFQRVDL